VVIGRGTGSVEQTDGRWTGERKTCTCTLGGRMILEGECCIWWLVRMTGVQQNGESEDPKTEVQRKRKRTRKATTTACKHEEG